MDAISRLGGLAIGINPKIVKLISTWGGKGFLGMDIFVGELGLQLKVINIYAPNQNRIEFWQNLLEHDIVSNTTIIGGDLNFSLGMEGSWGHQAQIDPISEQMSVLLEACNFVDVPMNKKLPTWHNRRTGEAALCRRLDHFLIHEDLIRHIPLYRQWVGTGGSSDHLPIFLQITGPTKKPCAPFKFFAGHLKDPDFINMVTEYWSAQPPLRDQRMAVDFCLRLNELKTLTKDWAKRKKLKEDLQLVDIEAKIAQLTDDRGLGFLTKETKTLLVGLENQKKKKLLEQEKIWRLKSRATWLQAGDGNTKFFHNYANGRKATNTIWQMPGEPEGWASTHPQLSRMGITHFKRQFTAPSVINLSDIINLAGHFPRFVDQEEARDLNQPVTMEELEGTLKWFKRDKSPGLDGLPVEFYLAFLDLLGGDLLAVIEESRTSGHIHPPINFTYLALIPKTDSPSSFNDFRPISLCNCLYEIISKIIANRIKPILSKHISQEQFAFLHHRHIQHAIGTAQEALHSIKLRNLKGLTLKIDLSKAFNKVNWLYIKMIITHLGFPPAFTNWIMGCISSVSFAILINGSASPIFNIDRGIRQGCPLSPLLFLLVMEGLSRLIILEKRSGGLQGLKITEQFYLTHLLFVDDILIFLNGSVRDLTSLNEILNLFCRATGMEINREKSTISLSACTIQESQIASQNFPFQATDLMGGLKYLGFRLKPDGYKIANWTWLITKVEKRINCWCHKFLSRAGTLILIKSVLEATPVYWMSLAWIPRGILHRIQQICCRFLWNGSKEGRPFAWENWKRIATPKKWGGWGLKLLPAFAQALAAKQSCLLLKQDSLWAEIILHKYIWSMTIIDWIRSPPGTTKAYRGNSHILPEGLIQHLNNRGIKVLGQIGDQQNTTFHTQASLTDPHWNLPDDWNRIWHNYLQALTETQVRLQNVEDELIWAHSKAGHYTPKQGYNIIIADKKPGIMRSWWNNLWSLQAPPRTRLLMWNILEDKIPTGSYMKRRLLWGLPSVFYASKKRKQLCTFSSPVQLPEVYGHRSFYL
eukprot:PITA_23181